MFSHVFVGVSDFERALVFYQPLMALLGIEARFCGPTTMRTTTAPISATRTATSYAWCVMRRPAVRLSSRREKVQRNEKCLCPR